MLTYLLLTLSFLILAASAQRRRLPPGPPPDPDQLVGRDGPSDDSPQLAGSKCAQCGEKILSALEAIACKTCKQPVHRECRKHHKQDAHGLKSPFTYR